jgi:hypothetical protein
MTQLDRGTDLAAIRVRRLAAVFPLFGMFLADVVGLVVIEATLWVATWGVTIVAALWLFFRPLTSPRIPDLREAVLAGDVATAHRMLSRGADARAVRWDRSLLDEALAEGDAEMARLLVAFGAEPAGDWLHRAASTADNPDQIALLLSLGCDPNAPDEHGWTPLHHAAVHGHTRVADALRGAGADPKARTRDGKTAADLAAERRGEGTR